MSQNQGVESMTGAELCHYSTDQNRVASPRESVYSSDKALPLSCSHTAYHTIISTTILILMRMGPNLLRPRTSEAMSSLHLFRLATLA